MEQSSFHPGQNEQEARIRRAERSRLQKRIAWSVFGVVIAGGLVSLIVWKAKQPAAVTPGEIYSSLGQDHIALNATPPKPYNSNPPSSGGHYQQPANWGMYDYEVNDKIFIHNLEHGGVWIAYRPAISSSVVSELQAFVDENGKAKLVMAPRSANDADVALVSWGHVYKFNLSGTALTEEQKNNIKVFYRALRDHGPEYIPGNMGGIDPKSVQP